MKTIRKDQAQQMLALITAAKAFTLSNGFNGEPIEDLTWLRVWATRMQPKVLFDYNTKKGVLRFHSNEWYEFDA